MKKQGFAPKNIVITGASSGIGAALAKAYAAPGVTLHLHGRNSARLDAVTAACQQAGASVHGYVCDVTDAAAMAGWLAQADAMTPIDLIIANAGISAGTGIHGENGKQVREIFAANIDGVVNSVQPLLPLMIARKHGQIALMSSLAGLRGLPSSPAYSASKSCVRAWGEGLRGWLGSHGVRVSVICPGYVKTPMTAVNDFPMPFLMDADQAARIIARKLAKNQSRIAFPLPMYLLLRFLACLPLCLTDPLFARLPAKPAISPSPIGRGPG